MKKKNLVITLICILLIILGIIAVIFVRININEKPTRELNKAVDMLKNGTYKDAYIFINDTKNEKNIKIINELISLIMINKMSGGLTELNKIATESTDILHKINKNNIDYSLDDQVNIRVTGLKEYIDVKNKIPKELLLQETNEIYDSYFYCLEYVYSNCKDMLYKIGNNKFIKELQDISNELYTISVKLQSLSSNYTFLPETHSIYEVNEKYF